MHWFMRMKIAEILMIDLNFIVGRLITHLVEQLKVEYGLIKITI